MDLKRADPYCCTDVVIAHTSCAVLYQREAFMADTRLFQSRMLMDPNRPTCDGRSILEMIEDELDAVMERLKSDGAAEDGRDPGRAEGLAAAIAIIRNPYRPDIDMVRAMTVERWEAKQRLADNQAENIQLNLLAQPHNCDGSVCGRDVCVCRSEEAPSADSE